MVRRSGLNLNVAWLVLLIVSCSPKSAEGGLREAVEREGCKTDPCIVILREIGNKGEKWAFFYGDAVQEVKGNSVTLKESATVVIGPPGFEPKALARALTNPVIGSGTLTTTFSSDPGQIGQLEKRQLREAVTRDFRFVGIYH